MKATDENNDAPVHAEGQDAHYLRAVAELGDKHELVTTEPIYNDRGHKLVDVGVRIDRRLYERLVSGKLQRPIDRSLRVAGPVDNRAVREAAAERLRDSALGAELVRAAGDERRLLRPLDNVPLPEPVAFRLTVMREQRPALYAQTIESTLIALYLGHAAGLDLHAMGRLAAAGLLHDLGMLHIDPALLADNRPLDTVGRRHLAAHPLTAMLIAREQGCYPGTVLDAIAQHHERLDGSGYPRGLKNDAITPLGRTLMVGEVAAGVLDKYGEQGPLRLSVILRLNHHKFEREHTNRLLKVLAQLDGGNAEVPGRDDAARGLQRVGEAIHLWDRLRGDTKAAALPAGEAAAFIEQRLHSLRRALDDAGYFVDRFDEVLASLPAGAPELLEMALLGEEARWQIENTVHAVRRRWPALPAQGGEGSDAGGDAGSNTAGGARAAADIAAEWCAWVEADIATRAGAGAAPG